MITTWVRKEVFVEIKFDDNKVESFFENYNLMAKKKGLEFTKIVKKRVEQIKAAETFGDYLLTGLGKPHPLTQNKKGLYGIHLTGNKRLLVELEVENFEIETIKKCKKVIIKGVEDYHGTKNTTYIP